MLRRVDKSENSDWWILIPQIQHARLAGGLADVWQDAILPTIDPRAEVVAAVAHHDDGWADWDAIPDVDPTTGRPLSFVEMQLETSIDIWRRSIYLACSRGFLAAHMVSAHFTALLQKAGPRWSRDPRRFQISRQFLDDQSDHRESWLRRWINANPTVRTRAMADLALEYLQFYDILSLWLCGAHRSCSQSFAAPGGGNLEIVPIAPHGFTMRPWRLSVPHWTWCVAGRRIPAARYPSREALAATPSESVELHFEFTAEY